MFSRFRAVWPRVLVPRACSVPRLTPLPVSVQHFFGSSSAHQAVLQRTNHTSIQKRTMVADISLAALEFGKALVELWIILYPQLKVVVDKWTDADQVCERCDAFDLINTSRLTSCVQKTVANHVLRYASKAIPMSRVKCKDLFFSRPTVNAMLSELVVDRRWYFLSGNSATGKTMGMHYFVRDTMRSPAEDRPYIPVTCHLRLRELDTEEKCKTALAEAMGLGNFRSSCVDWFSQCSERVLLSRPCVRQCHEANRAGFAAVTVVDV